MTHTITVEEKCDRCSSGFNSRQIDLEAAIRLKELEDSGEQEMVFVMRLSLGDGPESPPREVKYGRLCDGCRRVLGNLLDSAGPVSRRPRGPSKKSNGDTSKGDAKAAKPKGKVAAKGAPATKTT